MKHILTILTALLLVPLGTLVAADPPSLQPPQHLGPPRADQLVTNRAFAGIPSMAVTPKGRLWATWYAGVTPGEDLNNYVVLSTSGNGGATWTELLIVDPDANGPARSFDPELWVSPDGRLFFFWAQMEKGRRDAELGVWCIETSEPDSAKPTWSRPRRIGDGVMMCKPLTLSTGEWVLPISKWKEHDNSVQMITSNDQGKTWMLRGGCNVPKEVRQFDEHMFDEHMFVERKDDSLWLLVRTAYGIGESVSGAVKLRQLVSKATGGQEKPKPSTAPVHANADGKAMRTSQLGTLASSDVKPQAFVPGAKLFTDRAYIAAELPAAFKNAHFLPIAMNGQKTLKCERAGTVFFLTPLLERNRDTTAQALMDQGFEKVALPEIPLFNPASSANFCTLFQKDCTAGETILIGKWAVPVFFP